MSKTPDPSNHSSTSSDYRVLARKYRPTTLEGLIGQEALVRTLSNAFTSGRIAHAFLLTGVRGVGKTTTARIIARALNCIGEDGTGGPTLTPCGVCANCTAIAADRHVDIIEMDAASRTGVNDIREIIEGVRYLPVQARYKVYIIDEVHMLSTAAFNALLKTLEEPPPHVKFIFATTELRKLPVTVLSRCQRFDLRRVPIEVLQQHFAAIVAKEGYGAEEKALALIARAADGSVRDGLSLLDQAITLASTLAPEASAADSSSGSTDDSDGSKGRVTGELVQDMLGLADRALMIDLAEALFGGDIAAALGVLGKLYDAGAEPVVIIQDLLTLTHFLTRAKIVPGLKDQPSLPEMERERGLPMAAKLSMPSLARAWQLLLKGLGEVQTAPVPLQAAEMVLIRLAYASELPDPASLVRSLREGRPAAAGPVSASSGGSGSGSERGARGAGAAAPLPPPVAVAGAPIALSIHPGGKQQAAQAGGGRTAAQASASPRRSPKIAPEPTTVPAPSPMPGSFPELVELVRTQREPILLGHLTNNVHLVRFAPGRLEIRPNNFASPTLANDLNKKLSEWTGQRWHITISNEPGEPTLAEQADQRRQAQIEAAKQHPLVSAALRCFPEAKIDSVKKTPPPQAAAPWSAALSGPGGERAAEDEDAINPDDDPDLDLTDADLDSFLDGDM